MLDAAKAEGLRAGENPAAWRGNLKHLLPKRKKLSRGHHKAMPYVDVPGFHSQASRAADGYLPWPWNSLFSRPLAPVRFREQPGVKSIYSLRSGQCRLSG